LTFHLLEGDASAGDLGEDLLGGGGHVQRGEQGGGAAERLRTLLGHREVTLPVPYALEAVQALLW
jgi:hypothetical protein